MTGKAVSRKKRVTFLHIYDNAHGTATKIDFDSGKEKMKNMLQQGRLPCIPDCSCHIIILARGFLFFVLGGDVAFHRAVWCCVASCCKSWMQSVVVLKRLRQAPLGA